MKDGACKCAVFLVFGLKLVSVRKGCLSALAVSIGGLDDLDLLAKKLSSANWELHFVSGAGPCGYDIFVL